MKFLFQNPSIYHYASKVVTVVGGAERQQWLLAKSLAKRGHAVVVYSCVDDILPECEISGVIFKWITPSSPLFAWPRILQQEHPDWWYWRGQSYYLGYLVELAHLYRTKVIFACASDVDCTPSRALNRRKYLWPLYGLGLNKADRILVQHKGQNELLSPSLRSKVRLVPNLVEESQTKMEHEDYVAWVAVLREPKRPHLIVDLARRLPDVRFIVCGPASMFDSSSEYAANIITLLNSCKNIDYRGAVTPDEAHSIIRKATIFLSTSRLEGFPNTFLQAWSECVPVVSMEIDPGDAIVQNHLGIVTQTLTECSEAILKLMRDRQLNQCLGMNASLYIQQTHSEEVVVQLFLSSLN